MRIYHAAYRQQNPTRRAGLRGAKKQVHTDLMRVLENPGKPGRRKNPGQSIDAFNLLGELNSFIEDEAKKAGDTRATPKERKEARRKVRNFMALRDTVRARIEGYLSKGTLDYSLQEAMREMNAAEVRIVKRMIEESADPADPPMRAHVKAKRARKLAEEAIKSDPEIKRLMRRVEKAGRVEEETRKLIRASIRRSRMSPLEWGRGAVRHGEIREADVAAREELGDESYVPKDRALWKRVSDALQKKYPDGYIPARLKSKRLEDLSLLIEMNHKSTSADRQKQIRKRLEDIFRSRLRTKTILAYEKAGGRPMTQAEKRRMKRASSQKMQNLGEPFQVAPGMYGVVSKSNGQYKWALADYRGRIHFSGKAGTVGSASKNVGISLRILDALVNMDQSTVGWDQLPENDRRWLESNYPKISEKIARLMLKNIGNRVKVRKETAVWLLDAGGAGQVERPKKKGDKDMAVGEERVIPGVEKGYKIHVRRGIRNKYTMWVETDDGRESAKRRVDGLQRAISRGHAIGGAMSGAGKVTKAISNPTKIRRLNADARRFFAKQNPKLPREAAEEADIQELAGMVQIPSDAKKAFRYGLYMGIIRGIDTCGVQNYLKRKRIRKKYEKRILEGFMTTSKRAAGIGSRSTASSSAADEPSEDLDDILSSLDL
jgi:hypothetical protein